MRKERHTELILLRAGGVGLLRPERRRTSEASLVGDESLLFDWGEGATRQLQKAGVDPAAVNYLFFTHHHFDHNTDYPFFALTPAMCNSSICRAKKSSANVSRWSGSTAIGL